MFRDLLATMYVGCGWKHQDLEHKDLRQALKHIVSQTRTLSKFNQGAAEPVD